MAKQKHKIQERRQKQTSDDDALEQAFQANRALAQTKPYELHESQLHGLGMFSGQRLEPCDVILSERPLLERPYDLLDGNKLTPTFHRYFDEIRRMSFEDKTALIDIMATNKDWYEYIDSVAQLDQALKAPMTLGNYTTLQLATTFRQHSFPFCGTAKIHRLFSGDVHMLNHSCDPNAEAVWNPETRRMVVRAIKAIAAKEEITVAYVDPCQCRLDRRRHLGFNCDCTECHLVGVRLQISESQRTLLALGLGAMRGFRSKCFGKDANAMVFTPEIANRIVNLGSLDILFRASVSITQKITEMHLRHSGLAIA
ncbi:hypothetical protein LTR85_001530 [Meristemomyces frigidus]|nr:hypothetical protein LTR85_001530 [Meristemomyces frigidus]